MAIGAPDHNRMVGASALAMYSKAAGQGVAAFSVSGTISGETSGTANLPTVAANTEHIYIGVIISVNDDEAIHQVGFDTTTDATIWSIADFSLNMEINLRTKSFAAGIIPRITFTNNNTASKTFYAVVYYTTRVIA